MPEAGRRLLHSRSLLVEAFARDDGLFDLVALLRDVKPKDFQLETHVCPAGTPVHDMELSVTIDARMQIHAVKASTRAMPYEGACDSFADSYQKLVGLNLANNFRAQVRERVGGVLGCTHLTELTDLLPTVAVQAFAGEVFKIDAQTQTMPMQLGRCRALRLDGPVAARLYPRWARAAVDVQGNSEGEAG
jgi:hypothetical protein